MHELVLAGAARPHRVVVLGRAFEQDRLGAADAAFVLLQRVPFDDLGEQAHALLRDLGGHELVRHVGGRGARAGREHERVGGVVRRGVDDLERAGEVVVGLAGEADDEVGGHREVGDRGAGVGEALQVSLGGVAAVHAGEGAVAPRLQREVQVLAHRVALGHRRDGLGAEVLGVRRREANAVDAVDRVERAQQVGELRTVLPGAEVAAVGVDVLAEHGDLADAVGGELLDLAHDVAHAPADLGPAHDRHDAERARVVAADLDGDPRRVAAREEDAVRRAGSADGYASCSSRISTTGPSKRARSSSDAAWPEVVGAEHDVDVAGALDDELPVLLGQAAADRDLEVRSLGLQRLQATEVAVELVVGVLTDAARVQHDHVGRFELVGRLHALGREQSGDALGVVLVHLAPVGAHVEAAGAVGPRLGLGHGRSV